MRGLCTGLCLCIASLVFAEVDAVLSTSLSGLYEKESPGIDNSTITLNQVSGQFGASAQLRFYATGSRIVRARFESITSFTASSKGSVSLLLEFPKAYIRFRLPVNDSYTLRFSLGKDIYSWGEGRLYNAADVLNGARYKTQLDGLLQQRKGLSLAQQSIADAQSPLIESSSIRDSTVWASSLFIPMEAYSFTELLFAMPNNLERGILAHFPGIPDPNTDGAKTNLVFRSNGLLNDFFTGFRMQLRIAQVKTEFGYAYRAIPSSAQRGSHQPFLSLQGNLFVDWYLASAFHIDADAAFSTDISGGVFYTTTVDYIHGISVRLEALYRVASEDLFLFSELNYTLNELQSFIISAEFYVLNPAAQVRFGFSRDFNSMLLSIHSNVVVDAKGVHQGSLGVGLQYTF